MKTYYEILNVAKNADSAEIKKSFRALALKWHPDKNKTVGAREKFEEINKAYCILIDPEKRKRYDEALQKRSSSCFNVDLDDLLYSNYSKQGLQALLTALMKEITIFSSKSFDGFFVNKTEMISAFQKFYQIGHRHRCSEYGWDVETVDFSKKMLALLLKLNDGNSENIEDIILRFGENIGYYPGFNSAEMGEIFNAIMLNSIGITLEETDVYRLIGLDKLDTEINRLSKLTSKSVATAPHQQFLNSLLHFRTEVRKDIEIIKARTVSDQQNTEIMQSATVAIVKDTVSMLSALHYLPSTQQNDMELLNAYKKQCQFYTPSFSNFMQAIGVVMYCAFIHGITLGVLACVIGNDLILSDGKNLCGIPQHESILKRLVFQPANHAPLAAHQVIKTAKNFIQPSQYNFCFFAHDGSEGNSNIPNATELSPA
ncbi:molecular chaperone DnaJ [Legionella nautarum]|uniref:Molecular chaperone DnaJ n=1 Tax=Legionella nautarum TaxID=45070 RepID=A0A0W0WVS6_9GAMM|nr:J domain-containing protein [Legionella nautarum]KTD36418.1 molecular chaperone DnaJ [Legionella nautarum]